MADDTVEQARQAALTRMHCPERSLGDASRRADIAAIDALIAAVRAENVNAPYFCRRCNGNLAYPPQCQCDHPLPS